MEAPLTEEKIYAVVGEEGFARLVGSFYRQVAKDDILGPLYPHNDLPGAEFRLREFLIQRFGGPGRYSAARGHPRLRMRHAPFKVDFDARNRWMELMEKAMVEADLPGNVIALLRPYFASTATGMMNHF
jgi:hemoglobin